MLFKFCPNCKSQIKSTHDRLITCSNCSFHFYLSPAVTNALIIENNHQEILLVKRKFAPKKNYWDLPGGFIEFNETGEESLKREIAEELGIKIDNFTYFTSSIDRYLYQGINYHTLCLIYKTTLSQPKIKVGDDVSSFQFFPKKSLPFEKIAFDGVKNALKKLLD